jgi:hypothetical protein
MTAVDRYLDTDGAVLLSRDVDDLLLQLRGLVLVRAILAERGVAEADLDAHTHELERVRLRLASLVGGNGHYEEAAR